MLCVQTCGFLAWASNLSRVDCCPEINRDQVPPAFRLLCDRSSVRQQLRRALEKLQSKQPPEPARSAQSAPFLFFQAAHHLRQAGLRQGKRGRPAGRQRCTSRWHGDRRQGPRPGHSAVPAQRPLSSSAPRRGQRRQAQGAIEPMLGMRGRVIFTFTLPWGCCALRSSGMRPVRGECGRIALGRRHFAGCNVCRTQRCRLYPYGRQRRSAGLQPGRHPADKQHTQPCRQGTGHPALGQWQAAAKHGGHCRQGRSAQADAAQHALLRSG